jgi:hypothetical protein
VVAVTPAERQLLLTQVNTVAQQDLQRLWQDSSVLSTDEFVRYFLDAFPDLADPYHQLSAGLAATWFEESAPTSPYIAVTAPPVPVDKLTASTQWALGAPGDAGRDRLAGTLQRAVFDGARDTTLINVQRTESKWARYASSTACAFCRLLATRKAAYRSRNTAATKVHDHCHCLPVEVRDGDDYTPPDYVQAWEKEYIEARDAAGSGAPKEILAAWRSQAADIK